MRDQFVHERADSADERTSSELLRVLIADDEPIARGVLREELAQYSDVQVVGEAANGPEALTRIAELRPDLVLLDLQMPGFGGFEVIRRLPGGALPVIVIVTAYDEHAIHAFEAGAIDYLLKPVSQARLQQALERAQRVVKDPVKAAEKVAELQQVTSGGSKVRKIVGKLGEEFFLLGPDEILAFQADGELVWIITANQRFLATQNLRNIE